MKNSVRKNQLGGNKYTQHYNRFGRPTQTTVRKTRIGGSTFTQHYDRSGRPFKTSK